MIYGLTVESILAGALIFIRVSGILFATPFFGDAPTPVQVRVLLGMALALLMHAVIPSSWAGQLPEDLLSYAILVVRELCIGLFIGFVARLAFDAVIMAASLVGFQMGFGVADLFMPDADMQMNAFTAFHRIIIMMIFLTLNLHHMYIDAMARTFVLIPAGGALPDKDLGVFLIQMTSGVFTIAMQMAAPVLVALMFANTALGLIARTVPQLNVFTMSFPVGFFIGLFVYLACLPFYPAWTEAHFEQARQQVIQTIQGLTP